MERVWLKSYPPGVPAEIDADAHPSLGDFFVDSVAQYKDRTALISMGARMSYATLEARSRDFASYLQNLAGLAPGARVALMMPNLMQYPIAVFGALRAGCTVVNCNPLYSTRELAHQLADCGAEAIVVLENFAHVLEKALPETQVKHIIVTGVGDCLGLRGPLVTFVARHVKKMVPPWRLPGVTTFHQALAQGRRHELKPVAVKPGDVAFLQYTGGTTGVPKGAMLTHRNILANLMQVNGWLANTLVRGGEVWVTALPLYHVFALLANCFTPVMIGAANLLIPNPRDLPAFVKALRPLKFTVVTGVNTLFNLLLNDEEFVRLDFSSLKFAMAGGMAVQRAVAERWKTVTGKPLIEGYGLTETSPVVTINPLTIADYTGSIGMPLPSTEIALRDLEGKDVADGEAGELCVKGPQVMAGYYNRPDETAKVMSPDGYLLTGDIARVDARGLIYIVDRKKDLIIVSGFNVYPNEIEDVVMIHPGVREVGAIGVPDEKSGEAVKIVVVRKDANLTDIELIEHCRQYLTGYKTPRHVEFRDELPHTAIGKILRRELRTHAKTTDGK